MSQSRAIRSGASAIIKRPLVMLAELVWRWTLAAAVITLGAYSFLLFLHSLPVSDLDMFGLSGVIPSLFRQTVAHIFNGSGPKMIRIALILAVAYAGLWWLAASFGRTATLRALAERSATISGPLRLRTVFALNAIRLFLGVVTGLAYIAAFLIAYSISGMASGFGENMRAAASGAAGTFYVMFVPLAIIVGTIWSMLNWYLSLAPVVAATTGTADANSPASAFSSFFESALLSRRRTSQFAWVGFVFGILRFVLYVAAWFVFVAIVSLLAELPGGFLVGVLFVLALAYSVVSTLLNLTRLASYIRIVEWDRERDAELLATPSPPLPPAPIEEATAAPPAETDYLTLPGAPPEPAS